MAPSVKNADARKMPSFLDPNKIPFYLYLPNLMGYVRVITLLMAMCDPVSHSAYSIICLCISLVLDFFDGPAARRLGMCTQFGDILDHVTDHVTMFYMVWITSASQINLWVNGLHLVATLGYMVRISSLVFCSSA